MIKPFQLLHWLGKSLRERGLLASVNVAADTILDLGFDLVHQTDTFGWVKLEALAITSEHKEAGVRYQASKAGALRRLLRELALPRNVTFVDLGCGKGRVLLVAAPRFAQVLGVEFSPELCQIARANLAACRLSDRAQVIEADAARFTFGPKVGVIYLYNPFAPVVMTQVLANLRRSLEQHPRRLVLIYNTPRWAKEIWQSGLFTAYHTRRKGGTIFGLFTHGPNAITSFSHGHSLNQRITG